MTGSISLRDVDHKLALRSPAGPALSRSPRCGSLGTCAFDSSGVHSSVINCSALERLVRTRCSEGRCCCLWCVACAEHHQSTVGY